MKSRTLIALGAVSASTLVAHAGVVHNWNLPVNGAWNIGGNWDSGLVPGAFDGASLGHADPYTVSVTASQSVGVLSIANPNATLGIFNAQTMTINGNTLINNGLMVINSNLGTSATTMFFAADCLLDGTGNISLPQAATRSRIRTGAGMTMTQSASHMISGRGQIEAAMVNNGVIRADVAGDQMVLGVNSKTNNLLMEAVNGSRLDIVGIAITQGVNGVLHSEGVGSEVQLRSAVVAGGSMTAGVGARSVVSASSTLDSVFISGNLDVFNAQVLSINNSFTNDGLITVNSNSGTSATALVFNHTMILEGTGTVLLPQSASRSRIQTAGGMILTIPASQTILGRGQIEATIRNEGLIRADVPGDEMRLVTNAKTNTDGEFFLNQWFLSYHFV